VEGPSCVIARGVHRVWADSVAAAGGGVVVSTEPFMLVPNAAQGMFSHYWRTGCVVGSGRPRRRRHRHPQPV
jgi:hypothetical protein